MGQHITAPVGKGPRAINRSADVRAVQTLLNDRAGEAAIAVTGLCDQQTIAAITSFQFNVIKLPFPDALVMPGGSTMRALNDPQSRWGGMPVRIGKTVAPPTPAATPAALPPTGDPFADGFTAEIKRAVFPAKQAVFGQSYRDNVENYLKGLGGVAGRADDGRRFAQVVILTHNFGWSQTEVGAFVTGLFRFNSNELDRVLAAFSPASKFGGYIAKIGSAGTKLGYITLAIDVLIYGKNGDWGAAAGEVYKTYMNFALPWAAVVEGLQSLSDIVLPESAKAKTFFKILRVLDPVGLGGAAFDSVYSLIRFAMNANNPAEADRIINGVANRLDKGPAGFLKMIADPAADALYKWINSPPTPSPGR